MKPERIEKFTQGLAVTLGLKGKDHTAERMLIHQSYITIVREALDTAIAEVPQNWLDPLLTGNGAVIGKKTHGPDMERVLLAVRERIRALKP